MWYSYTRDVIGWWYSLLDLRGDGEVLGLAKTNAFPVLGSALLVDTSSALHSELPLDTLRQAHVNTTRQQIRVTDNARIRHRRILLLHQETCLTLVAHASQSDGLHLNWKILVVFPQELIGLHTVPCRRATNRKHCQKR